MSVQKQKKKRKKNSKQQRQVRSPIFIENFWVPQTNGNDVLVYFISWARDHSVESFSTLFHSMRRHLPSLVSFYTLKPPLQLRFNSYFIAAFQKCFSLVVSLNSQNRVEHFRWSILRFEKRKTFRNQCFIVMFRETNAEYINNFLVF